MNVNDYIVHNSGSPLILFLKFSTSRYNRTIFSDWYLLQYREDSVTVITKNQNNNELLYC